MLLTVCNTVAEKTLIVSTSYLIMLWNCCVRSENAHLWIEIVIETGHIQTFTLGMLRVSRV